VSDREPSALAVLDGIVVIEPELDALDGMARLEGIVEFVGGAALVKPDVRGKVFAPVLNMRG
jgi:hypothetical protein